jgi:exonuclease III
MRGRELTRGSSDSGDKQGCGFRMVTWNISSAKYKTKEIREMLDKEGVSILGLQETRRSSLQYRLRFKGYKCFESLVSEHRARNGLAARNGPEPGRNGLALVVRNNIGAFEVVQESGYWIILRVFGGPFEVPCIVGTVYRPHDKDMSVTVLRDLEKQVEELRRKYPDDPIILMGDWNLPTTGMGFVEEWAPSLGCVEVQGEGGPKTFYGRGRGDGDIDHVVVDKDHAQVFDQWRF